MRLYEALYLWGNVRTPQTKRLSLYNHYIRVFPELVSSTIPKKLYLYLMYSIFLWRQQYQ
jgi:hypothetical protein